MEDRLSVCCFTGHRRIESEHLAPLKALIRHSICQLFSQNIKTFVTGGARGFDTLAAETVLEQKSSFGDIRLVVVAPCETQSKNWPADDARRYERIRLLADEFICLSQEYSPGCMKARNMALVDMSGICIAYCRRKRSGTSFTVNYARTRLLPIINLADQIF
jgi:uncharacterized phage-like protein YoqJ